MKKMLALVTFLMIASTTCGMESALPQDQDACHLSLFLSDNWKKDKGEMAIYDSFMKDPELVRARSQCFFHVYTPSDMIYRTRFAGAINTTPTLLLQDSDGQVYYKNSQMTSDYKSSFLVVFNQRPWLRVRPWLRPKPCPGPEPCPNPDINPDINPDMTPSVIPDTVPVTPEFPWPLLLIIVVAAVTVTILAQWRKRT
jgi:hypothetical protein